MQLLSSRSESTAYVLQALLEAAFSRPSDIIRFSLVGRLIALDNLQTPFVPALELLPASGLSV